MEKILNLQIFQLSRCGHLTLSLGLLLFTNFLFAQCDVAPYGIYPAATFTPIYTGSPEIIATDSFAGEYSKVNILQHRQYVFTSSNPNDYITVRNSTNILAFGQTPVTWNSNTTSGVINYYIHTNSSCGVEQIDRVRSITAGLTPSSCNPPNTLYTTSITNNFVRLYQTDSNPIFVTTDTQYFLTTSNVPPSINTNGFNFINNFIDVTGLTPNTTYYYWARSKCGIDTSPWVLGNSFTTLAEAANGCGNLYGEMPPGTFTPGCFGNTEIISTNSWPGSYSVVNIQPNKIYTFTSSVATDFITIKASDSYKILASGTTPLVWPSGSNSGAINFHINTNSSCGTLVSARTKTVSCQDALASCAVPSSFTLQSTTSTSANVTWVNASPIPSNGYQYYYSTTNVAPAFNTIPSGSSATNNATISGLTANTTYYFWVRSNCGGSQSIWVFGNSITTTGNVGTGCTTAIYGLYPTTTFTPACFGLNEIILTNARAGEYCKVNTLTNTQYTFTSSVISDYITITNADASIIYIAGNTPLVWNSASNSGVIRYYLHSNSSCGAQNLSRTKSISCQIQPCNPPTGLSVTNVTNASANLNWTATNPIPSNGYAYYYSTSNTAPTAATTPSGTTINTSIAISSLIASTTYYFWVRASCDNGTSSWISGTSFTTPNLGCTTATYGQLPSTNYTPSCNGTAESILTNAFAGQYSSINILTNRQYTFSSSVTTDYVTITNSNGSVIYGYGNSPFIWQSGANSGTIRFYLHTNSICGEQNTNRTRFVSCTDPTLSCPPPSFLSTSSVTSLSAQLNWTAPSPSPAGGYDIYISILSFAPTSFNTPTGNVPNTSAVVNGLTPSSTYYFWVRSHCSSNDNSAWISGGSFTTPATTTFCSDAIYGLYPSTTFTPNCSGLAQIIASDSYASEYANVNIQSNKQYTFASSNATDFITITNANGLVLLANGNTPLTWNSNSNTGIIRYYFHTNSLCGFENSNRIRFITCSNTLDNEEFDRNEFVLYPNPVTDFLNLSFDKEITSVSLYNLLGQEVITKTLNSNEGTIDVSNLQSGTYLVKVIANNLVKTLKIIKE